MKCKNLCMLAGALLGVSGINAGLAHGATPAAPAASRAEPNPYEAIVSKVTPTLVTIKFTMKISGSRGEQERPMEVAGVMIRADGLVLASNVVLNPASVQPGGVTAVPTDVKILIGDDTEGVPARLVATDKELDLAWVQIDQPTAEGYKALDLGASSTPELGVEVVCVERMGKVVDRAPKVLLGHTAGIAAKPRRLFMTDGLNCYPGTPAFTADGKLIGVVSFQLPDGELDESVMNDLGRLGPVILPVENIAAATKRVLEQEAERAKSGDAPKPAAPAPEGEKK